jgi:hypothetical protein
MKADQGTALLSRQFPKYQPDKQTEQQAARKSDCKNFFLGH